MGFKAGRGRGAGPFPPLSLGLPTEMCRQQHDHRGLAQGFYKMFGARGPRLAAAASTLQEEVRSPHPQVPCYPAALHHSRSILGSGTGAPRAGHSLLSPGTAVQKADKTPPPNNAHPQARDP